MGKGSDSQEITNRVDVPDFLQPLVRQQSSVGQGALSGLQSMLGGAGAEDLVAGFSPAQLQAMQMGTDIAQGGGGFLPTAQNTLMGAAQGSPLSSFMDPSALSSLQSGAMGQGINFLPEASRQALMQGAEGGAVPDTAMDFLGQATQQSAVPDAAMQTLQQGTQNQAVPQQTLDTLRQTAGGDFLMGGEGFDAAVDAAMRSARPQLLSTFGRAGSGGATGGLAQTAIAQAAQDAFARQFGQERQNQLSAANTLGDLGLQNQGQQLGAAQALGDMGLAGQGQQMQAAGLLGDLGLSGMGQQIQAGGLLGDFAGQDEQRQLSAAGQLTGLSDAERQRQLSAAGQLPGIGMAGADILSRIGAMQQGQQQQELTAPITAQQQLLNAMGGGIPLGALLGNTQTTTQESSSSPLQGLLGLGLTGASLFGGGGLFPGVLGGLFGGDEELQMIPDHTLPRRR